MLAQERMDRILQIVEEQGSALVPELVERLKTSESTIRRDLNDMSKRGLLKKVHGGAIANSNVPFSTIHAQQDSGIEFRKEYNIEEKKKIAEYAASLISDRDLVFLDAGSSTGYIIEYLQGSRATYVTNGIIHALTMSRMGLKVYVPSGEIKEITEAIIGEGAIESIRNFRFTLGFFGTNGVHIGHGFTTPDIREAKLKEYAMKQCENAFVLCDSTKMDQTSSVRFGDFHDAIVLTVMPIPEGYVGQENVVCIDS